MLAIPKADCGAALASIGITLPSKAAGKGRAILGPPIRSQLPRDPDNSSPASSSTAVGVILTTGPVKKRSDITPRKYSVTKSKSKRADAPLVYNFARGSKKRALEVASGSQEMNAALAEYVRDWKSAGDVSCYYMITWIELHQAYGEAKGVPRLARATFNSRRSPCSWNVAEGWGS